MKSKNSVSRPGPAVSPFMRKLSAHIAGMLEKPLPEAVMERAKVHMVDTLGAMVSGSRLPPGKKAMAYVKSLGGKPEACVVGTRILTSASHAALANAMSAHADETDDTHPASRTHPGAGIVPSILAIGERNGSSGQQVLRALVLGYDLCARMMLAIDEMHFRDTGNSASPFGQVFGAGAASAALLGLDATQVRYMLSYAAQQAAGLATMLRDTEHIEKAFVLGGLAARNGTSAALMAASGFTGVDDVFSGHHNFFRTFAPQADLERITQGLGRKYEIMNCGIKRWPAGGPIQGPLCVLDELIREEKVRASDVLQLTLRMPDKEFAIVDNRDMPDICVQHLVAVMLLDGKLTFKSAHDLDRMRDPKVLALRKRLTLVGDPALTDSQRRWRAAIVVHLKDGRVLSRQTLSAKGGSDNPLSREDEEAKALDLMVPVLGKLRTRALLDSLWSLDSLANVRSLRKHLVRS